MSYGIHPQQSASSGPSYGNVPPGNQMGHGYPTGSQPGESLNFTGAVKNFFRKWKQFTGRASRSEFWYAILFHAIVVTSLVALLIVSLISMLATTDPYTGSVAPGASVIYLAVLCLNLLVSLIFIVPNIALTVRRLHDTNKPGAYYFLSWIPFVGPIILLVFCAADPDPAGAAYDE